MAVPVPAATAPGVGVRLVLAAPCTSHESVAEPGRAALPVFVIFPAVLVKNRITGGVAR